MRPWHFRRERTVEIAAAQGIAVPQRLDDMIGAAAAIWTADRDFDRFVQRIHDRRLERPSGGEGYRVRASVLDSALRRRATGSPFQSDLQPAQIRAASCR